LNQPYSSHGNRTWHKLAENAIASFGETPESDLFLKYAVTKFFGAYPVWSDDDGGWHEGLSYLSGYMSKATWWMDIAGKTLGIPALKKPFFSNIGDYAMYSAPPGTPDLGLGDLAHRPPSAGWSFMYYFAQRVENPHWVWWLQSWKIPDEMSEPVLDFLWSSAPPVAPQPPSTLPQSKIFKGTGIAVLNTNLENGLENVQVRFKASPMGRWSHGHDPHNSFTLNAYGVRLLVNNVYRDLYGSPFHKGWVWTTRAQNAVLVNGEGQKPRSADLGGRIIKHQLSDGFDYVAGDATESYEGRLKRARRHVFFVKPDVVIIADDLESPKPSTFQWMLHADAEFRMDESKQRLVFDAGKAGVMVDYAASHPLKFRQWTGYDPPPDAAYLASVGNRGIPPQWHVEAASTDPAVAAMTFTVLRVYRDGRAPQSEVQVEPGAFTRLRAGDVEAVFSHTGAVLKKNGREWKVEYAR
jgi:hypothetical protein